MLEPPVYLFVYGTLQSNFGNPFAQFLRQNSRYVGGGTLRGFLYNIGQYPGAVHDANCPARIYGSVYESTEMPGLLTRLDKYEGVSSPPLPADEYVRAIAAVSVVSDELLCWTYLYNWPTDGKERIESGRYAS